MLFRSLLAQGQPAARLSADAEARLLAWPWPGNLRELHNVIEFARAVCHDGVIEVHDLPDHLLAGSEAAPETPPSHLPAEAQLLLQYLRAAHWNVSAVAHQMGIARMTVYRRMRRWGLAAPERGGPVETPEPE